LSYQVLARKYRSQTFDQMVGQNHISQTIMNALKNNRLPHALLFTGIRGTGKTSSARILAKSIRCTNSVDFKPCGVCENCIEITAGRATDVIEIDGASNNGVDAIRDLRDSVMFSPSSGKYKIFIIDEVHMLSSSAFNALLKTLEEPPPHVIFIMATTEIQKIPQTILSRCQRFDFRRIPIKQLAEHLKWICDQENIKIDDKALWLLARQGEGSARDSLSLLDQVINFSTALQGNVITDATVSEILGLTDRALVFEAFQCLIHRNDKSMLALLKKLSEASVNGSLFLDDLLRLFRHSILLRSAGDNVANINIDLPIDEITILIELIQPLSISDLHMLFDMCFKSMNDVIRSHEPLLVLEISLLRMAQAPQIKDLQSLMSGGTSVSAGAAQPPKPAEQAPKPAPITFAKIATPIPQPAAPQPEPPVKATPVTPKPQVPTKGSWFDFVQFLKQNEPILAAKVENLIFDQLDADKIIHLGLPPVFGFLADQITQSETKQKLQGCIDSFFGSRYNFEIQKTKNVAGESALNIAQQKEIQAEEKLKDSWAQDPRIKKAQEVFNGTIKVVNKVD
jgi:DNA polymerase III subunit gamma/tau